MKYLKLVVCCAVVFTPLLAFLGRSEAEGEARKDTEMNVVASWSFDGATPGRDTTGRGNDIALRGKDSSFVAAGKTGEALEIKSQDAPGDTRQGAATKNANSLNFPGAFTLELCFSPDPQLANSPYSFLLDKKYYYYASNQPTANTGYLLGLRKAGDKVVLQAQLGFGTDSVTIESSPQSFETGRWYQATFTYDGAGNAALYVDKTRVGQKSFEGRGGVTTSRYPLVIGDRVNSLGQRFHGKIDDVRILDKAISYASGKVLLDASQSRTAFYRKEEKATLQVDLFNDTGQPLTDTVARIGIDDAAGQTVAVPRIEPNNSVTIQIPLDTNLRPGDYRATVSVKDKDDGMLGAPSTFSVKIVARPLPHQMPLISWDSTVSYQQLADIGFTHQLIGTVDYERIWKQGDSGTSLPAERLRLARKQVDDMMALQIGALATLTPGKWVATAHPEFNRKDRQGKPLASTNGLLPAVGKYAHNTGTSVARTFGDMPNWKGALIQSELRDKTALSFSETDVAAYRKFSGQEIPSQAFSIAGVTYQSLPDFPANRIIPDEHPLLKYYAWFWKDGDGWNALNSQIHEGLIATGRDDIFTWYDPAVRVPSIYGSGGNVTFLNQWTYTYPDPLKVSLATDELFAMAGGRPGQKVMNMVQLIWYRSRTTRKPAAGQETQWEKTSPDAKFISIAPDHLSEGTWLQLAHPIQAMASHGWGSLGARLGFTQSGYTTTNLETRKRLTELHQNVVKPLGPTLLQVPDRPAEVAFLQSFASQIFANRGTYGWGDGWGADAYLIARYAGLQPQIVYDETVRQKGLKPYKVLFLMHCDVVTQAVADVIGEFQQGGGIVIGDEYLAPGIQPDIVLTSMTRGAPDVAKAALLKKAAELRQELEGYYRLPVESSNPEVVTRLRQFGSSRYLFTVNDHRTYGDYVGQYKMVMEKGLPSTTEITLNGQSGFVYDLMKRSAVKSNQANGKLRFEVQLKAGDGNVFLITEKAVGALRVNIASQARRGGQIPVEALLPDVSGQALDAVVPLQVTIRDSQGRVAEQSGHYGATRGTLRLNLDIAPNDATGKWQIEVSEGLSGQIITKSFEVM